MRSPEELQQERIDEIQKEKHLRNEIERLRARLEELKDAVHDQAEDYGLWLIAATAPEAYLQRALRYLHALVEQDKKTLEALAGRNDEPT